MKCCKGSQITILILLNSRFIIIPYETLFLLKVIQKSAQTSFWIQILEYFDVICSIVFPTAPAFWVDMAEILWWVMAAGLPYPLVRGEGCGPEDTCYLRHFGAVRGGGGGNQLVGGGGGRPVVEKGGSMRWN
jgi:hypothetical protein